MCDVWTEADLPRRPPRGYRVPLKDYRKYRKHLVGQSVKPERFSHEQLQAAGYWKHCSLGNF